MPVAKALRTDLSGCAMTSADTSVASQSGGVRRADDRTPELLVDYTGDLLPDAAHRIQRVVDQFEELNWFSSHGQLLTVGASPVVMDLVRWLCERSSTSSSSGRAAPAVPGPGRAEAGAGRARHP